MTNRYAHIRTLVELRKNIRQFPTLADTHLRNTLIESLPPKHATIYRWICSHGSENITSSFIVAGWQMSQNQAADMLRELWEFGLLKRTGQLSEDGKRFIYEVEDRN